MNYFYIHLVLELLYRQGTSAALNTTHTLHSDIDFNHLKGYWVKRLGERKGQVDRLELLCYY